MQSQTTTPCSTDFEDLSVRTGDFREHHDEHALGKASFCLVYGEGGKNGAYSTKIVLNCPDLIAQRKADGVSGVYHHAREV